MIWLGTSWNGAASNSLSTLEVPSQPIGCRASSVQVHGRHCMSRVVVLSTWGRSLVIPPSAAPSTPMPGSAILASVCAVAQSCPMSPKLGVVMVRRGPCPWITMTSVPRLRIVPSCSRRGLHCPKCQGRSRDCARGWWFQWLGSGSGLRFVSMRLAGPSGECQFWNSRLPTPDLLSADPP